MSKTAGETASGTADKTVAAIAANTTGPKAVRWADKTPKEKRAAVFAAVTITLGVIAIVLLALRLGRAWILEYGHGPRPPRPMPTESSFGTPGGPGAPSVWAPMPSPASDAPATSGSATAAPAPSAP